MHEWQTQSVDYFTNVSLDEIQQAYKTNIVKKFDIEPSLFDAIEKQLFQEGFKDPVGKELEVLYALCACEAYSLIPVILKLIAETPVNQLDEIYFEIHNLIGDLCSILNKRQIFLININNINNLGRLHNKNVALTKLKEKNTQDRKQGGKVRAQNYREKHKAAFQAIEALWDTKKWKKMTSCAEEIHIRKDIDLPYQTVYEHLRKYKKLISTSKN